MSDCCCGDSCAADSLKKRQKGTLKTVLIINALMFAVEFGGGLLSHSTALLADSLDMLGDALAYGVSLYVIDRGEIWKARSALLKGGLMFLLGVAVLFEAGYKMLTPVTPDAHTIGIVGVLALIANLFCLYLLTRHRDDDINMHSVWVCSRNDIINNSGVLIAAGLVAYLGSAWPDIVIGLIIAAIVLRSSWRVIARARRELALNAEAEIEESKHESTP